MTKGADEAGQIAAADAVADQAAWWRREPDGVVLSIRVQPGARRAAIAGVVGEELKVQVAARAVEGKANEALVRFLAEALGVPRRSVRIVRGEHHRSKVVEIQDPSVDPSSLVGRPQS